MQGRFLFSEKSLKSNIIEILSNEWPLSARSTYNKLCKNTSITYQAVHKHLKEMVEQGIITKGDKGYKLSEDWLNKIGKFSKDVKKGYETNSDTTAVVKSFSTLFDGYMFFLDEIERHLKISNFSTICFQGIYMWNGMVLSKEDSDRVKVALKALKIYTLTKNNTIYDQVMKKFWGNFGVKVKLNADCPPDFETIVMSDTVYYLHLPEELLNDMDRVYRSMKTFVDIDIAKIQQEVLYKKHKIYIIVNKNKEIAETLTNRIIKVFEDNK